MSLINEALKRARIEAARRDAAEKGVPAAALPVYVPQHRRNWLAPFLGFVVGLAVFAVAAGAYWLARRPATDPRRAAAAAPAAPSPPPAVEAKAPSPSPGAGAPVAAPAAGRSVQVENVPAAQGGETPPGSGAEPPPAHRTAPPRAAPPSTAPGPARAAAAPELAAPRESPSSAGRPDPRETDPRHPAAAEPGSEGGRTYFVEAEPAGGARVKLDFIVWSETRPFAQINGELISPGQVVEGYTLLAIERERVELEGGGARFWIRAR